MSNDTSKRQEVAYCHICKQERSAGYCIGLNGKLHPPETCPPCNGCKVRVCNWRYEAGCAHFPLSEKALRLKTEKYFQLKEQV